MLLHFGEIFQEAVGHTLRNFSRAHSHHESVSNIFLGACNDRDMYDDTLSVMAHVPLTSKKLVIWIVRQEVFHYEFYFSSCFRLLFFPMWMYCLSYEAFRLGSLCSRLFYLIKWASSFKQKKRWKNLVSQVI